MGGNFVPSPEINSNMDVLKLLLLFAVLLLAVPINSNMDVLKLQFCLVDLFVNEINSNMDVLKLHFLIPY